MVRISKLTDYGVLIMTFLAQAPEARFYQAREISQHTSIAAPTVSKLLKTLVRHKLLASHRGVNGGYHLNVAPESISVVDLIRVLEGPIAITECSLKHDTCPTQALCGIRAPWQHINRVITKALDSVKLSDLVSNSHFQPFTAIESSVGFQTLNFQPISFGAA